jgi:dTDP-glucose 4,6-dehydratase
MRVLVTGGAGFVGSAVVRYLVHEKAYEVLTVDKLTNAGSGTSLSNVKNSPLHKFLKVDVCDRGAIAQAFETFKPERVIHLAAESHVDRSDASTQQIIKTNITGTFTLLEAARYYWERMTAVEKAAFRFLHVSTVEVYGSFDAEDEVASEEAPYDPSSPYAASKAASDHLVRAWGRTYGLPIVIAICSSNYGPYQFPEKLIPMIVCNGLESKMKCIYGNGTNVRDWTYVEDSARALHLIAERGRVGETYNVGGHQRRTIDYVFKRVCALMDTSHPQGKPHVRHVGVPDRPGNDARHAINSGKLRMETAWKAQETFETGVAKTVQWYLDNEWW